MQPTAAAEAMRVQASNQTAELTQGHHACRPQALRRPCKRKQATKQNSRAQTRPQRMQLTGAAQAMRAQASGPSKHPTQTSLQQRLQPFERREQ